MTPADIRREADELERFLNAPPKAVAALRALADVVEWGLLVEAYIGTDDETGGRFYEAMKHVEALKP